MLATEGVILTKAGSTIISKALELVKPIEFVHIKIGSGDINSLEQAKNLTDLVNDYKTINMSSIIRTDDTIRIRGSFTNENFTNQITIKEIGVFAKVGTDEPALFAYVNDGIGETIPAGNSGNLISRVRDLYIGITSETKAVISINKGIVYATIEDLEEGLNKKEDKFSKNSGFNKVKTDIVENDTNKVFTALGALNLKNWLVTNYTTLMNNIRGILETAIGTKLAHGGYGGTGQTLFNLIESAKTSLTSLINGKLNHGGYSGTGQDLKNAIDGKQNTNDNTLQTDSKSIAGAINELFRKKLNLNQSPSLVSQDGKSEFHFDWLNDIAGVRVGGDGAGANNGFAIRGVNDEVLLWIKNNRELLIGGIYDVWSNTSVGLFANPIGFMKCPNGIIIQWGDSPCGTQIHCTFPTAFNSHCVVVPQSYVNGKLGVSDIITTTPGEVSLTGFKVNSWGRNWTPVTGHKFSWIAVGY